MLKIGFCHFNLDQPMINTWFGGMYNSLFKALEEQGCIVSYSNKKPKKDTDVLVLPMGGGQDKASMRIMSKTICPIILNIGAAAYWFRKKLLIRWKDRILFLYGTDFSEYSYTMASSLGIPYHNMPFGSNPNVMRPLHLPKQYDVVFVGNADSGMGRHQYVKKLLKVVHDRKILFLGSGWEKYGYPFQSVAWGELLNIIYNLSHICINISNNEQKDRGSTSRLDANNRLFDLAMAGCFQISNAPQLVKHYFNDSEVLSIDSPDEWIAAIEYYLTHKEEMVPFKKAARKKALEEHNWKSRAIAFKHEIETHMVRKNASPQTASIFNKIIRLKDLYI